MRTLIPNLRSVNLRLRKRELYRQQFSDACFACLLAIGALPGRVTARRCITMVLLPKCSKIVAFAVNDEIDDEKTISDCTHAEQLGKISYTFHI